MPEKDVNLKQRLNLSQTKQALLEKWIQGKNTKVLEEQTILRRSVQNFIPLSFAQQRLWFLDQLEPESTAYLLPSAFRLAGKLNAYALEWSVQALIDRHESLRTIFVERDGQPVQVIQSVGSVVLPVIDLQGLRQQQREEQARELASQEAQHPADLARGPLLRTALLHLQADEHVLLLTLHHIITDGWSNEVLIRELTTLYRASVTGEPSPLGPLPIQYADYALWQRGWLQGEVLKAQLAYWRTQLTRATPLALPSDHPRPAVQTLRGASQRWQLPLALSQELQTLSQQEHVTLFMTLLASFQVLLMRYSGQSDISVGTPIANRQHAEIESVIGFFVNTLVLRSDLSGNPSFVEVLRRVREVCLGAYAHQDVPFEQVVEALEPERDLSRSPLFQAMFVLQNVPREQGEVAGIQVSSLSVESVNSQFDLALTVRETQEGLQCSLEYNINLFEVQTIQRLLRHWQTLLEGIVQDPQMQLWKLPLLTVGEQEQLLRQWNTTRANFPQNQCVHQLFEQQAERTPDAVALMFEDQVLTYGELNRRANQLAHHLQRQGVGPEGLVGICVERSVEMIVGLLGVLKSGGGYVPLDPAYPSERLAFMLTDTQMPVLLTQHHLLERFLVHGASVTCLDRDWPEISRESVTNPCSQVQSQNLAYIIYTSGSTGMPKGVIISHQSLANYGEAAAHVYDITPHDCVLQFASISFDASVEEIYPCLIRGATLVLRTESMLDSVQTFVRSCHHQGITCLSLPTAYWHEITARMGIESLALPLCLRLVIIGGETANPQQLILWQRFSGANIQLINTYGLTESTVVTTLYKVENLMKAGKTLPKIPIGSPIANSQVYILDAFQQLVPIGIPGELYIGGEGLAQGYLNRPELTAERFVPDLWSQVVGARLYRTGDLARYRSDGDIEYLGRMDQQVKIRGYRIELGEIEAVLGQHPGVQERMVLAREDVPGDKRLVAYVVGQPGPALTSTMLRSWLQDRLPGYLIPAAFVFLDALPLTPNGKVDRRALPLPEEMQEEESSAAQEVKTLVEELLEGLWSQVLGRRQIRRHDNFFEMGGHSLLATQLLGRVRQTFKVELPLRTVFEAPSMAEFAQRVEQALRQGESLALPALVVGVRPEELPLSFAQQRLWFLDQLEPESTAYLLPSAFRLTGKLNAYALEWSMQALIDRHESLRTIFVERDGQPVQVIQSVGSVVLPVIDLQGLRQQQREEQARELASQEAQHPADLARGPLLRTALLHLQADEHVLLLTLHHIITDGWSNEVLIRELTTLYRASVTGEPSPLGPLPIQYADYALWQRGWLQGEVLKAQLAYWRTQLTRATPLALPSDHPRPAVQTLRGASQRWQLPLALSQELQTFSQQEHVTLFMTLLASFQVLLMRYSGQSDISVGTPIANRQHAEIESVIGFFVNTLVLRSDLSGNPSFVEVLRRVREVCLGAYAHQDVPFEQVVEALEPERDLSRSPLFQVMFVLQNVPREQGEVAGIQVSSLSVESVNSQFDLTISIAETEQGLRGMLQYNTDLFESATMIQFIDHWQVLLAAMVQDVKQTIQTLPLLTREDQHQLVLLAQANSVPYVSVDSIQALFSLQAQGRPEAIALVFEEEQVTYGELERRANQLAQYLRTLGITSETRVGVCVDRSYWLVIGLLGILKAGGVYVPLDPAYPAERRSFLIKDAQVTLILTQEQVQAILPFHSVPTLCLDRDWHAIGICSASEPEQIPLSLSLAYMIYTSGSTGQPKGTMITHHGLCHIIMASIRAFSIGPETRLLQQASMSFDNSVWEMCMALVSGAVLCLGTQETMFVGDHLAEFLHRQAITTAIVTPSVLALVPCCDYPSLQTLLVGGESCPAELALRWSVGRSFLNTYGPAEATIHATYYEHTDSPMSASLIGRPNEQVEVYVLDTQWQLVPRGVVGELYIGGVGVARGYFQQPALTAERFVPHPFSMKRGDRLYRSGDSGRYLPSGDIEFLGRVDQQVKIHGVRIELGEIEAVLGAHPGVQERVVLAREDVPGDKRLVAYVVGQPGPALTSTMLRSWLQDRLLASMLPSVFVFLDALPLTPNGKVDRRALPLPEEMQEEESSAAQEARTPVEELLVGLWNQVLGRRQIGRHDNFFEVGGHSLLATQLIGRVRQTFEVDLPLRTVFEASTVASFAQRIEQALCEGEARSMPALVARARPEKLPLSFAQQRLWFLDQLEPESTAYLIPLAFRVGGALDARSLERSIEALIGRHESLRTIFTEQAGQPVQVILPAGTYILPVIDLRGLEPLPREQQIHKLSHQEAQRPCNLAEGPLLRTALLCLEADKHVFLLTLHHIITDGWSTGVLVRELTTLYRASMAGQPSSLAPLPIQYADYALWQRQWLQGEVLQQHVAYWKAQLWRVKPLELPTDVPHTAGRGNAGATYSSKFSMELWKDLVTLSQQEGVTMFMLLLTIFQVVLYRLSGQTDIVLGTDVANRTHVETEGLIGFFVNLVALRTDLRGAPSLRKVLHHVRAMVLGAYTHQALPFEMVVEQVQGERDGDRAPVVQALFVMQNTPPVEEDLPDVTFEMIAEKNTVARFDIAMFLREGEHGLSISTVYRTALFHEQTIATVLRRFEVLARSAVARPDTSIDGLEMYSMREKTERDRREKELNQVSHTIWRKRATKAIDVSEFTISPAEREKGQ